MDMAKTEIRNDAVIDESIEQTREIQKELSEQLIQITNEITENQKVIAELVQDFAQKLEFHNFKLAESIIKEISQLSQKTDEVKEIIQQQWSLDDDGLPF